MAISNSFLYVYQRVRMSGHFFTIYRVGFSKKNTANGSMDFNRIIPPPIWTKNGEYGGKLYTIY